MDKVFETTNIIFQDCILKLRNDCSKIEKEHNKIISEKDNKIADLVKLNDKLISELNEKDKMLLQRDKTIHDYSIQIETLSQQKTEEENSANKVSMYKAQDKVVNELIRDKKLLEEKVKYHENQVKELKDYQAPNVKEIIEEVNEVKTDEVKVNEVKTDEVKTDEVKVNEVKTDEVKTDEVKTDEVKVDEVKTDEVKVDEVKVDDDEVKVNDEDEDEDEDEDNPYIIFEYNGTEYGFDSSVKIEKYYEIDEENNTLGKAVSSLKLVKPKSLDIKEVFILHDKKKKYMLECLEGYIPGKIIGEKKGNDYILNK